MTDVARHEPRAGEDVAAILAARARALARPLETAAAATDMLGLVMFRLAGERYALDVTEVREVFPLREVTPVPGAPPAVLGVAHHRGRILAVLDLRTLFDLPGRGDPPGGEIVWVAAAGMTFGVLAASIDGAVRIAAGEVAPPPATLTGPDRALVRGVTAGLVTILDGGALARDPRILGADVAPRDVPQDNGQR